MRRREFMAGIGGAAAWPGLARGQQATRLATVGWLTAQQASSLTPYIDALRAGFGELGYIEGRNLAIVFRYGDDTLERVPELAKELVRIPVDVLLVQGAAVPVVSKLGLSVPAFGALPSLPILNTQASRSSAAIREKRRNGWVWIWAISPQQTMTNWRVL
jgi:putative ABC transport system substrate-binding protein